MKEIIPILALTGNVDSGQLVDMLSFIRIME